MDALISAFGEHMEQSLEEREKAAGKRQKESAPTDEELLHGPQLKENAKSQEEIDALLFGTD